MINKLLEYLDKLYDNPRCELNYNEDYEFLIAVVLSAQTTDKMVNRVTSVLFNKYDIKRIISELMPKQIFSSAYLIPE